MIRIYLDWNVMSQLKNGLFEPLLVAISDNAKFFKLFSTSHIGDIGASDQADKNRENIQGDLDYILKLTEGYCVLNNNKEIIIEQRSPHQLFDDRTDVQSLLSVFDFGKIIESLGEENSEILETIKPLFDLLTEMPISNIFEDAFNNPQTSSIIRQFLPDLEDNYTIKGLLGSIISMVLRLNEKGDYKQLREILQSGLNINRDKIFAADDPYKLIDFSYKKNGLSLPELPTTEDVAPDWFNKITNEYIKLDMHGFQEDKVNIEKGRKETFRNTTEDAFHTAFATTCDFYITNDKKNYRKAEILYEKLRINTLVLTPNEFIDHYRQWLHFNDWRNFAVFINAVIKHCEPVHVSADGLLKTYIQPLFIFDYFNKIYLFDSKETPALSITLAREKPTNNRFIYKNEVTVLINKLLAAFGEDIERLNQIQESDIAALHNNSWLGRRWAKDGLSYHLKVLNGYLQFYISLPIENLEDANQSSK